jgi:hypothetical protein
MKKPVDDNHALLIGALVGSVIKWREDLGWDYHARILDDAKGNYLDTFEIAAPSGTYRVTVEPYTNTQKIQSSLDDILKLTDA